MAKRLRPLAGDFGGRRLLLLMIVAALLGAPAGVLRALCAGRSCDEPAAASAPVPFCSLPGAVRDGIAEGYYEGRSPDVMVVTGPRTVSGGTAFEGTPLQPQWPASGADAKGSESSVPIVFAGAGVAPGARVPAGTGLDDIAPTVAEIIDLARPHPEVRSGRAVAGVATGGAPPRLVLEIVWKGVGSGALGPRLERAPALGRLLARGAGTLEGAPASLPLDPSALLATVGTGGRPREHGITGAVLRNDAGRAVQAWGRGAPPSVIATLPDDLDQKLRGRPVIGLAGSSGTDRGLIGGNWYIDVDRDAELVRRGGPGAVATAAIRLLRDGFGTNGVPDLLGIAMDGPVPAMDAALARIQRAGRAAARGSVTTVATATGGSRPQAAPGPSPVPASRLATEVERRIPGPAPVVEATTPGGLFLNQATLARRHIRDRQIISALLDAGADGRELVRDAFAGIAVSFERYC